MRSEPALIGPIVLGMFSRYDIVALGLSLSSFMLEMMSPSPPIELFILVATTLLLAIEVGFDIVIKRREGAAQTRG